MNQKFKILKGLFAVIAGVAIATSSYADKEFAVNKVKGSLSVMVLGSGGPVAASAGRASSGYLIFTDGKPRILMDVGGGIYARVAESGVDLKDLDTILLTHLHLDHTADMSAVVKTIFFHNRRAGTKRSAVDSPIHIYGPQANPKPFPHPTSFYNSSNDYVNGHYDKKTGLERYIHAFANVIEAGSFGYKPHEVSSAWIKMVDGLPMPVDIKTIISTDDGLVVKAVGVFHGPVPALGYLIEYKGKSIAYSGDTQSKTSNMIRLGMGVDMLIYDTAIMADEPTTPVFHILHTEPARLGQVAEAASPKTLVLSHITPVTDPRMDEVKDIIRAQGYQGKIRVAKDLKVYNLDEQDDDD